MAGLGRWSPDHACPSCCGVSHACSLLSVTLPPHHDLSSSFFLQLFASSTACNALLSLKTRWAHWRHWPFILGEWAPAAMLCPQRPPTRLGSGCSLHGSSALHPHASTQMPSLHVSSRPATAPPSTPSEPPSLWVVLTYSLTPLETCGGRQDTFLTNSESVQRSTFKAHVSRVHFLTGIPSHTHRPRRVLHRAFLPGARSHWPPTWRLCHSARIYCFPALPDTGQVHGFLPA